MLYLLRHENSLLTQLSYENLNVKLQLHVIFSQKNCGGIQIPL